MHVAIQRDPDILVTEDFADALGIHSDIDAVRGKGKAQNMEIFHGDSRIELITTKFVFIGSRVSRTAAANDIRAAVPACREQADHFIRKRDITA